MVTLGREAVLSCTVTRLRDFKVGWVKVRENLLKIFSVSQKYFLSGW